MYCTKHGNQESICQKHCIQAIAYPEAILVQPLPAANNKNNHMNQPCVAGQVEHTHLFFFTTPARPAPPEPAPLRFQTRAAHHRDSCRPPPPHAPRPPPPAARPRTRGEPPASLAEAIAPWIGVRRAVPGRPGTLCRERAWPRRWGAASRAAGGGQRQRMGPAPSAASCVLFAFASCWCLSAVRAQSTAQALQTLFQSTCRRTSLSSRPIRRCSSCKPSFAARDVCSPSISRLDCQGAPCINLLPMIMKWSECASALM